MVEFKRERLSSSGARPLCRHHASVAADVVTDDWEDALQTKGASHSLLHLYSIYRCIDTTGLESVVEDVGFLMWRRICLVDVSE